MFLKHGTTFVNLANASFIERFDDRCSITMLGSFSAIVVTKPAELAIVDRFLKQRTLAANAHRARLHRKPKGARR